MFRLILFIVLNVKIGGMIVINCFGINVVCYGIMRDWVINLIVVLVDGLVIKMRCCLRKCFVGYNLNGLFVGFEGMFGIVIVVIFKLVVIFDYYLVVVVFFVLLKSVVFVVVVVVCRGVFVVVVEFMDEE